MYKEIIIEISVSSYRINVPKAILDIQNATSRGAKVLPIYDTYLSSSIFYFVPHFFY